MASLTIRNLDADLKVRLRLQAAQHGCSMEAEVRAILYKSLIPAAAGNDLASRIHNRFEGICTEPLPIPPRQAVRTPPSMGE